MKIASRFTLLIFFTLCLLPAAEAKTKRKRKPKPAACSQGTPYRNCPACGTATDKKHRTLNVLKNRDTAVTNPQKITVQEIRDPANDQGMFTSEKRVWVTGFVASEIQVACRKPAIVNVLICGTFILTSLPIHRRLTTRANMLL